MRRYHLVNGTRGWEKVLEHHVLKSVRLSCPWAPAVKSLIANACTQDGELLEGGRSGQDAFDTIFGALCQGLCKASSAAVMQTLQNLLVPQGTMFSVYLSELGLLASNVRCVGQVAPEGDTMQPSIKNSVDYQFASLSVQIVSGRNMWPAPFDIVEELLGALDV